MERELIKRKKRGLLRRDESGQVLVLVALCAVFLIGMVALVVDISHGLVVRNELQNAADASALAGAGKLFNPSPGPNWSVAKNAASSSITWNRSDGKSLGTCTADYGVWDRSQNPAVFVKDSTAFDTTHDPAVRVQVSRAGVENDGPVPTWFARIFGINSIPVGPVSAVAVVSNPGLVTPGPLLPVAIGQAMAANFNNYKDSAHTFQIGSSYHYPISEAGQWSSLLVDSNNVPTIQDLIQNGTPQQIKIGDKIWIQPGTKNTLYDNKNQPSISWFEGKDVFLPVVNVVLSETTHEFATVVGFIGFHVVRATGGSTKTIEGYFVSGFTAPNSGGSGPNYGAWTPPRLVL